MKDIISNYLSFYKKVVPAFTEEELDFIGSKVTTKAITKNEFYLKQGETQKKLGYVVSGLLRKYYIDTKGNEITVGFSSEKKFSTDYGAFVNQEPSKYNIKSIEPSMLIELDFSVMQGGYNRYKNYERFGRLITEKILIERQKKIESFLFETAEQRYLKFTNTYPNLFNRVSVTHLSSYLGIERQSLTRIRKRLLK